MIEDLNNKSWSWFSCTSRLRWEGMEIKIVAGNNPTTLCLPVVIIN
jgi:hypothetical protein